MPNRPGYSVTLLALVLTGCVDEPSAELPPPTRSAAHAEETQVAEDTPSELSTSERRSFDGLRFIIPAQWKEMPLSDFQRGIISARFQMPDVGPDVSLTLSRASGGLDSNLDRWRGQFQQSRQELKDSIHVAGKESTIIDLQGAFSPGFGKDAAGEWRMIGIVVPLSPQSYFMKLTGPVDEVARVEEAFRTFAKSSVVE